MDEPICISNPDRMMQPMWTPTANTFLPVPGMGGHYSAPWGVIPRCNNRRSPMLNFHPCSSRMLFSINNSLFKLPLTSTSRNNFLHQPSPNVPSPPPTPTVPPSSPEPPQPKAPPEGTSSTPTSLNPEEMIKQLRANFKEGMTDAFRKFQESNQPPSSPAPPSPVIPPQSPHPPPVAPQSPHARATLLSLIDIHGHHYTDQGLSSCRQGFSSRQTIHFSTSQSTSTTCKIHSFQTHTPASLMLTEIYLSLTTLTDQVTFIGLSGTTTTLPPGPLPRLDISTAVQLPAR